MSHLPWIQIFIGDELAETSHLSAEEYGTHMRLRLHQWQHGELPADEERLRRIAGLDREEWARVRGCIAPLFGDRWHHDRTHETRMQSEGKRNARVEAGKKGGRPKSKPQSKAEADEKQNETSAFDLLEAKGEANGKPSPSPSPSPLESPSASNSQGSALEKGNPIEGTYTREANDQPSIAAVTKEKKETVQQPPARQERTARAPSPSPEQNAYRAAKGGASASWEAYPIPPSKEEGKSFLRSLGVPFAERDRLLPYLMDGKLKPFDIERLAS